MRDKERIPVFVKMEHGKTLCICKRNRKKCDSKDCEPEVVERDRFEGWEKGIHRDRWGHD